MKSINIINITYKGSFLYRFKDNLAEGNFEGFTMNTSLDARLGFQKMLGNTIECTVSKNNLIRYKNISILKQLLNKNIFKVNEIEMSETKIFSPQQKKQFEKICQNCDKNPIHDFQIVDVSSDKNILKKLFKGGEQLQLKIQYLQEDMIFRIQKQKSLTFVPFQLRNISHYFNLISQEQLAQFLSNYQKLKLKVLPPTFNIKKNSYECEIILQQSIEQIILKNGWGNVRSKNICRIKSQKLKRYRQLEKNAQQLQIGIYKKPFEILNFVYTSNNFIGLIQQIIQGHIVKVKSKTNQSFRIQLPYVLCPSHKQLGAFECRQFTRKNLIGKQVNILIKQQSEFVILANIIRLSDNKDFQTILIQNGYGHIKQQYQGSIICGKLQKLQKIAKTKRKGLYEEQKIGYPHFQDYTIPYNKKDALIKQNNIEKKMNFLKTMQSNTEGVLEKMVNSNTFIVRIDAYSKIIRLKLDGVKRNTAHQTLPEAILLNKQINQFFFNALFQRTVLIELTDYDSVQDNLVGIMKIRSKGKTLVTLQKMLIQNGYVYVENYIEKQWAEVEELVKKKQLNIWSKNLHKFNRTNLLKLLPNQFKGMISWVQNRQVIYIQPSSQKRQLQKVYKALNNKKLEKLNLEKVSVGLICACSFEGEYARAAILSQQSNNNVMVSFLDWGNRTIVRKDDLKDINDDLRYIPSLCCQVKTNWPRLMKVKKQYFEKVKKQVLGCQVLVKKNYGNTVYITVL